MQTHFRIKPNSVEPICACKVGDSIINRLVNELNNLEDKQVIDIVIVEYNVGGKGFFS